MADNSPFRELERVFGEMSQQFGTELSSVATDVIDEDDAFVVKADLPGYDADEIEVELDEARKLTITAEREAESQQEEGRYVKRERRQQAANRTVRLPAAVDPEETSATYDAGVLTVRLEKQVPGSGDGTDIPVQ